MIHVQRAYKGRRKLLSLRCKFRLALVFLCGLAIFVSLWRMSPVVVNVADLLGPVSHVGPLYWVGLAALVAISTYVYVDREVKQDTMFIAVLMVSGWCLVGVSVLAYENPVSPNTYYPFSEVHTILVKGHVNVANHSALRQYYSWPAYHLMSATVLEIAQVGFGAVKYAPLLWVSYLALITYTIGKRIELPSHYRFAFSFLILSSWLIDFTAYYHPRQLGMVLFLLLLAVSLQESKNTMSVIALVLPIFTCLVCTHGLTSIAALLAFFFISLWRKKRVDWMLAMVLVVVFSLWYVSQAALALDAGVRNVILRPLYDILRIAAAERHSAAVCGTRSIARYAQIAYAALYACMLAWGILSWVRKSIEVGFSHRAKESVLLCWLFGAGFLLLSGYGEAVYRVYLFGLVPAAGIVSLAATASGRNLLIPAMVLCPIIFLPANYSAQVAWGQVCSADLMGSAFFASRVDPSRGYFSNWNGHDALVLHYEPSMVRVGFTYPGWLPAKSPDEVDINVVGDYEYVIISWQGSQQRIFAWGEDPYASWPETRGGELAYRIYENGNFQTYLNPHTLDGLGVARTKPE